MDPARSALAEAVELLDRGERDAHRAAIDRALALALDAKSVAQAHTLRAEDAYHGANQLSQSAQRAPTPEACDEGWTRVESLVAVAEASARIARTERADRAARAARRIVAERNHAYTFHADVGFSFGEGWYVAAAAVLAAIPVQIEPGRALTCAVERFVRDAGLGHIVHAYRPRPRANKALPAIIARAFRHDPSAAQSALRRAFLGGEPVPRAIAAWIDARLGAVAKRRKVLVWIRTVRHHPHRNTDAAELRDVVHRVRAAALEPIFVGDPIANALPEGVVDLTWFWKDSLFCGDDARRSQLQFFEHLRHAHAVVGQVGVTTAGMDGPALVGMPTLYFTDETNPRMAAWVDAVPGYRELVREPGWQDRLSAMLAEW